ncbi:transposase [Solimonas sp. K1W22B-7]|uniref:transposase n=1 Tax=Solimonas sp. K1W22B-7 TaxID=2303331 RepID=UPI0013C40531|nr:transposase [Solimonas sp. K1W22B-7]
MGTQRLAAGKKNAGRLKAWLGFLDESGILMAPLVRRSWSLRGQTPVLQQRGRHHSKVSVIAALCISPSRRQVTLHFRLYPDTSIDGIAVRNFLRDLHVQHGRLVMVWDRSQTHRARSVRRFLDQSPNLQTEFLPAYAPELNPVEYIWAWLKTNPLANLACHDLETLTLNARHHARRLQHRQDLLRSFIEHSPLPLRLIGH